MQVPPTIILSLPVQLATAAQAQHPFAFRAAFCGHGRLASHHHPTPRTPPKCTTNCATHRFIRGQKAKFYSHDGVAADALQLCHCHPAYGTGGIQPAGRISSVTTRPPTHAGRTRVPGQDASKQRAGQQAQPPIGVAACADERISGAAVALQYRVGRAAPMAKMSHARPFPLRDR